MVREQIWNPIQKTPVLNGIVWRIAEPVSAGNILTIIRTPESFRSFVAILRLDDDTGHVAGVTLPPPGTDGSELFSFLELPEARGPRELYPLPILERGFLPFVEAWRYIVDEKRR